MTIKSVKLSIVAVLAAAVVAGAMSPALAATSVVKAGRNTSGSFVWKPSSKSITKGNAIRWRNPTGVTHNVVAYGGNWSYNKTISSGSSVRRTFKRRGVFRYLCTIHGFKTSSGCNGMCGRVNVS